jgi:hypothetical protein
MAKKILIGAVVLLLVVAVGAFAYYQAMVNAWIRYNEYDIRTEGQLQVGDLAPDLELARADGEGAVMLSDLYRERPVVLAFGSYT